MADNKPAEKPAENVAGPSTEKKEEPEKKKLPQLGALEDDDEFEVRLRRRTDGGVLISMTGVPHIWCV